MNFAQRSYRKELLDRDDIPFADIRQNMRELDTINTLLGGHRITLKGFNTLRSNKQNLHICEIGCGGGDNLLAVHRWCRKHNIQATFTGVDMKPECVQFAQTKAELQPCTTWVASDYKNAALEKKPDIIFSSLFCHHFTDEELVTQLQWMKQNAAAGFFINDLHRHPLAYHSIKLLTRLFSKSYLVKHDAPLSVQRGFCKEEWEGLFAEAGIVSYQIQWQWAFRYLIVCRNE